MFVVDSLQPAGPSTSHWTKTPRPWLCHRSYPMMWRLPRKSPSSLRSVPTVECGPFHSFGFSLSCWDVLNRFHIECIRLFLSMPILKKNVLSSDNGWMIEWMNSFMICEARHFQQPFATTCLHCLIVRYLSFSFFHLFHSVYLFDFYALSLFAFVLSDVFFGMY